LSAKREERENLMPAAESSLDAVFQPGHVLLDYRDLSYNPGNDLIFPSVVRAEGCLLNPADAYYMYYAPHDAPGGICLAHAPSIEGPWKEHAGNPLIQKDWPPHHQVGHVSAPHAIWVAEESRLFVYYHGDNDQTHYAVSQDGIRFSYGGVALDQRAYTDFVEGTYDRVFYGRVFAHRTASRDSRYVMLVARSSNQGTHRNGIYLSWSQNARDWSRPVRVIQPAGGAFFVCSPCLFALQGRFFVAYHAEFAEAGADSPAHTDIWVDEFDAEFAARRPLGKLVDHRLFGPANPRVADPLVLIEGDVAYLVLAIETRLNQRFALAKADRQALQRALFGAAARADP
jgi:hypothetical protein